MARVFEALSPARLGTSFRWLLGSSWVSNVGDGIGLAAGPLLIASLTDDPALVALAVLLQRLPWLLFGLYAGVLADRLDRRLVIVFVDSLRAVVLAVLTITIVSGVVNVALVLVVLFVFGTAETFADTATQTLLPMLVAPEDLGAGNSRLVAGLVTGNQLLGPVVGAALFAAGNATPFAVQAACVGLGALLISRIHVTARLIQEPRQALRRSVAAGFRWLWGNPPVRTLTITMVTFNVTYGASISVLVLYARERLGLGDVGFGLLLTASAVGGVLGSSAFGWIERHFRLGSVMRVGLVFETVTHLVLALTTTPAIAFAVLFVFGIHAAVWGTIASSVRHRAVPEQLQGRVTSIYFMAGQGGLVAGAAVGGLLAAAAGITAPFWFGFLGSACLLAAMWRALAHVAQAT